MLTHSPLPARGLLVAASEGQDPWVQEAVGLLQHLTGPSVQVGRERGSLAGCVVCFALVMMQWYHFHAKC